jgi:hypothetical protein
VRGGRRGILWVGCATAAIGCAVALADQPGAPQPGAPQPGAPAPGNAAQVDTSLIGENERLPLTFAVSPFAGYRVAGTFTLAGTDTHVDVDSHAAYALALDLSTDGQVSQYELFFSRQSTSLSAASPVPSDLVIEYLHVGGTATFLDSTLWHLQPYLIGSLGATRFDPALGDKKTDFSASVGVGARAELMRHLSLRLEARGFVTVLSSGTPVFCRSNATGPLCDIQPRGSAFLQADLLAGLSYAF